jgi:hypothetical protein
MKKSIERIRHKIKVFGAAGPSLDYGWAKRPDHTDSPEYQEETGQPTLFFCYTYLFHQFHRSSG